MRTLAALLSILLMIGLFPQCQRNRNEEQQAIRKRSMMDGKRDTVSQSGIGENSNRMRDQMRGMMQQMMPDMLPPGIEPDELPDRNSQRGHNCYHVTVRVVTAFQVRRCIQPGNGRRFPVECSGEWK